MTGNISTNRRTAVKPNKADEAPLVIEMTDSAQNNGFITTTISSHETGPSISPPNKKEINFTNNGGDGALTITRKVAAVVRFPTPVPLTVSYPKNWNTQDFGLMSQFLSQAYGLLSDGVDSGEMGVLYKSAKDKAMLAVQRKIQNLSGAGAQGSKDGAGRGGFLNVNQTELLFQGIDFREINMSHTFAPNSEKELRDALKIVNTFKKYSAPKKGGAFRLIYPKLFELEFGMNNGGKASQIFKTKPVACTNVTVDYTPDQLWNVFNNGHPVMFKVDFAFKEIELLTEEDFDIDDPFNSH